MNRVTRNTLTLAAGLGLSAASSFGQNTWWVDDDGAAPGSGTVTDPYVSIQFALAQATTVSGDTVQVLPGTYFETINYQGKTLTLRSTDGARSTVIDAVQAAAAVTVGSGEGVGTVLEGFTVTGGLSPLGGGIRCVGSTLAVRECIVDQNEADLGGGVYASFGDVLLQDTRISANEGGAVREGGGVWAGAGSTLTIEDCEIRDNRIASSGRGGGVYVTASTATITGTTFLENRVGGVINTDPGWGGGLYSTCDSNVTIAGCTFERNGQAQFAGGGLYGAASVRDTLFLRNGLLGTGEGGGASGGNCVLELFDCELIENGALGEGGNGYGGGVARAALVSGCRLIRNRANFGGGALASNLVDCEVRENVALSGNMAQLAMGGGLDGGSATGTLFVDNEARGFDDVIPATFGGAANGADLERCVLLRNRADIGGALASGDALHCSFFGNEAKFDASVLYAGAMKNSIAWGNVPLEAVSATWSIVEGGAPGTGNLDLAPRYWAPLAGDLHLRPGSPAIDAGDPTSPRDPDGSVADMGAFPFDAGYCGPPGSYCDAKPNSQGCLASVGYTGAPTLSGADDFFIEAQDVLSNQNGVLIWSLRPAHRSVYGGVICVRGPLRRQSVGNSGGNATPDCSGRFAFHFSQSYMNQAQVPLFVPLHAQIVYRDPGQTTGAPVAMTDALEFVVCP